MLALQYAIAKRLVLEKAAHDARSRPGMQVSYQRQRKAAHRRRDDVPRDGRADHAGLRPHRNLAGHYQQPTRRQTNTAPSARPIPGVRSQDRRGRRDPRARPQRHARLLSRSRRRPRQRSRTAGFTPATSARSTPDGFLRITDRKKEVFKTATGKYVSPARVEAAIKRSVFVAQAMVVGDGRPHPAALIAPNWDLLRVELNLPVLTPEELVARDDVQRIHYG